MEYIYWLQKRFPGLVRLPNTATEAYIAQAKADTKWWRGIIGVSVIIALILPLNILLSSSGFEPFESAFYWCTFLAATLASGILSNKVEQAIIKRRLAQIIEANHCQRAKAR